VAQVWLCEARLTDLHSNVYYLKWMVTKHHLWLLEIHSKKYGVIRTVFQILWDGILVPVYFTTNLQLYI